MLRIAKKHAADCEMSWDICGVILQSHRNRSTDVPSHLTSSIYSGTSVEQLRWDCNRIADCIWIIRIVVMKRLLSGMCTGSPGVVTR